MLFMIMKVFAGMAVNGLEKYGGIETAHKVAGFIEEYPVLSALEVVIVPGSRRGRKSWRDRAKAVKIYS